MAVDLAIIGAGGAAYAAAIAARRDGRSVVMIERDTVGGTCVNTGCVPSKALLAAAEARHTGRTADRFPGLSAAANAVDVDQLRAGKDDLVAGMRSAKYTGLAADYGWEIVPGEARFVPGPALEVALVAGGTRRVAAEHYLVATGSAPWTPPVPGLAGTGHLTSTTAMELPELPSSMLVVGGNYVGLEQAQLFARLGVRVRIVELAATLAPTEEPELATRLGTVLADEGIAVHTGTELTRIERAGRQVVADLRGPDGRVHQVRADELLLATGRRPVTDGLDLPTVGVGVGERGEVVVDGFLRTAHPRIWAAGDVTGHPQFVYVAATHGALVVDNAFREAGRRVDHRHLPRVTFTSPQLAAVGPTEAEARALGADSESRVLPLEHVPRAVVNRDTRGAIKLVAEHGTGRLLGAHALADGAGELVAAAGYALRNGMTVTELGEQWCPYLTMTEGLKLAAQAFSRDVTKLSCCAS